ncbi:hypothetical protein LSAT2_029292 [Lamellibrachia satsuma]|nr:hypothetical protein LSAT2_029292 [Lamellibrachia satsuma]
MSDTLMLAVGNYFTRHTTCHVRLPPTPLVYGAKKTLLLPADILQKQSSRHIPSGYDSEKRPVVGISIFPTRVSNFGYMARYTLKVRPETTDNPGEKIQSPPLGQTVHRRRVTSGFISSSV